MMIGISLILLRLFFLSIDHIQILNLFLIYSFCFSPTVLKGVDAIADEEDKEKQKIKEKEKPKPRMREPKRASIAVPPPAPPAPAPSAPPAPPAVSPSIPLSTSLSVPPSSLPSLSSSSTIGPPPSVFSVGGNKPRRESGTRRERSRSPKSNVVTPSKTSDDNETLKPRRRKISSRSSLSIYIFLKWILQSHLFLFDV